MRKHSLIFIISMLLVDSIIFVILYKSASKPIDKHWDKTTKIIIATLKDKPRFSHGAKGGSHIELTLNEYPIKFLSPGYEISDYVNKSFTDIIEINDKIEITVLLYDFNKINFNENNPIELIPKSIVFYGLKYNEQEYVSPNALIELKNPTNLGLLVLLILIIDIIAYIGYKIYVVEEID